MSLLIYILIVLILLQVIVTLEMHRLVEDLVLVLVSVGQSWFSLVRYHVILLDVVV